MNVLFWNTKGLAITHYICQIVSENFVDTFFLAEYEKNDVPQLLKELYLATGRVFYNISMPGSTRLTLISALPVGHFQSRLDSDYYSLVSLKSIGMVELLLVGVHMPSKMHATEFDQVETARDLKGDIAREEIHLKHQNTVVVGDFNMNPFDKGMVTASALGAVSCARTARDLRAREIKRKKYDRFYNPTWNLLGDARGIAGSFYLPKANIDNIYWQMLDQVVVRPDFAPRFNLPSLRLVTAAGSTPLLNAQGRPAPSDHLPLFFSLSLGGVPS
ncbi:hypothetical protein BCO18430_00603 [Burkholderia contaminans]|nr:hypothetical protein BCO18430_00603 [Burkholderia contaminans]